MRIASLSPVMTEILFALEQQKKIVCTDKFSDYPDAAKAIPKLIEHQKIDPEALRVFTPDVVFTSTLVQANLAEQLKKEGFAVVHQDPRSIGEVYENIRNISAILDCTPRAEALIATMQHGFSDTKRKSGLLFRRLKVYVEEWHNPPMLAGNWVPELVKLAGGIPLEVKREEFKMKNDGRNPPSCAVSLAEVQAFDPDIIVLSISGAGTAASKELLTEREVWSELRAVKSNHLFVIDDNLLNRPGPRLTEAAKRIFGWCFQALH